MSLKEAHESFPITSRGPVHKDQRLQIDELDEWQTQKPRTPDKPKLRQNELDTSPNQLKVGDKVLLDAVHPHIVTTTLNEEIALTVLSIFPFGTVEVSHPEFSTFKTVMTNYDDPDTVQFRLGRLIYQLSVPKFGATLALYTKEFKEENELHALSHHKHFSPSKCCHALSRHIHFSPLKCWHTLAPSVASYNPSCSKTSVLPPSLRYLHTILAHTIIGRQESTGVVNTHDAYFLWCMSQGQVIDLAYFIALAIQHKTERHRKGMSPQGISSMLSMRMIERCRGTYPPQYRLTQSTEEEANEDIPDDVPHSTRTHQPNHHHPLVQFMRQLHMLTSLSSSTDSSSSVFNV
ncbi:hypothetical protein GOBAR_AA17534 [Gossypium barbadense]|uniref:Uncharacterized protein n=1 Tax=Gossypium barbadense TaxID=3634 RepID=A0A2P5XIE9_GOSBA|nr:hypothetical protein GOBAR_AA17534 [Gossypium barbadense]